MSGTKLHATAAVSRPVGRRSTIHGATMAPSSPSRQVGPEASEQDPRDGERHGVRGEGQPAGQAVEQPAQGGAHEGGGVVAGLVPAQRGGQLRPGHDRPHRTGLRRREDPGRHPGEERDDEQVGHRDPHQQVSGDERPVGQDPHSARGAHHPAAVHPVGQDPGGQEGAGEADEVHRLGERRGEDRPGQRVGEQR